MKIGAACKRRNLFPNIRRLPLLYIILRIKEKQLLCIDDREEKFPFELIILQILKRQFPSPTDNR